MPYLPCFRTWCLLNHIFFEVSNAAVLGGEASPNLVPLYVLNIRITATKKPRRLLLTVLILRTSSIVVICLSCASRVKPITANSARCEFVTLLVRTSLPSFKRQLLRNCATRVTDYRRFSPIVINNISHGTLTTSNVLGYDEVVPYSVVCRSFATYLPEM